MALVALLSLGTLGPARADEPGASDSTPTGPSAGRAESAADPWASADIAPRMESRPLVRGRPAALETGRDSTPAGSGSWARTTLALGGVVGLILLLAWGYRQVAAHGGRLGFTGRGRHAGLIEVISRTALSPRQAVCLVRVGPRLVLLGVSPDAIRTLDVIQDPELVAALAGQALRGRAESETAAFASCLEREARGYRRESAPAEPPAPDARRLAALKEQLAGTLARLRAAGGTNS